MGNYDNKDNQKLAFWLKLIAALLSAIGGVFGVHLFT